MIENLQLDTDTKPNRQYFIKILRIFKFPSMNQKFEFLGWRTFKIRKNQIISNLYLNWSFSEKKMMHQLDPIKVIILQIWGKILRWRKKLGEGTKHLVQKTRYSRYRDSNKILREMKTKWPTCWVIGSRQQQV